MTTVDRNFDQRILRAREIVLPNHADRCFYTDLTKSELGGVRSRLFREFIPVKASRNRLPTTLTEFSSHRYTANLSDSPVIAAAHLGGSWKDHNLALICHVAACNLRCRYCYVSYKHLGGADRFPATSVEVVDEFLRLAESTPVTILRISGGEPLLAPEVGAQIWTELDRQGKTSSVLLKMESNLTALSQAGLLRVRLTFVSRDEVSREGCRYAEEVPTRVQA